MRKKLAIVINTFNGEKFLSSLLNRLLNLNNFNDKEINIYIFDDFSSDNTFKSVSKYLEDYPFITFKTWEKNCGIFFSRLNAMQIIEDDFLIFIDQDDWLEDNILDEFFKYNNSSDFLITKRAFVYEKNKMNLWDNVDKTKKTKIDKYIIFNQLTFFTGIFMSKSIYKNFVFKDFLLKYGNVILFEDVIQYTIGILLSSNPINIDSTYFYNKTNENSLLTTRNSKLQFFQAKYIIDIVNDIYLNYFYNIKEIQNVIYCTNIRMLFLMYEVLNKNDKVLFLQYKKNIIRKDTKTFILSKRDKIKYLILKSKFFGLLYRIFIKNIRYEKNTFNRE